jgi:hypothetical protein
MDTFQCFFTECKKNYCSRQALEYHLKKIHLFKKPEKEEKKYICETCKRNFNSRQSLRYHNLHVICELNNLDTESLDTDSINTDSLDSESLDTDSINTDSLDSESLDLDSCIKNEITNIDSSVVKKEVIEEENNISKIEKLNDKIEELFKIINNLKNNNETIVINNNTINNYLVIVEPGLEDPYGLLTKKEKIDVLKHKNCLEYLIKKIHFNKNIPNCCNFYTPSLYKNKVKKYSSKHKKFIYDNLNNFIEEISHIRINEIDDFCDIYKNKINLFNQTNVKQIVNSFRNNQKFKEKKINKIKKFARKHKDFIKNIKNIDPSIL